MTRHLPYKPRLEELLARLLRGTQYRYKCGEHGTLKPFSIAPVYTCTFSGGAKAGQNFSVKAGRITLNKTEGCNRAKS
jgi:hypothetical protein